MLAVFYVYTGWRYALRYGKERTGISSREMAGKRLISLEMCIRDSSDMVIMVLTNPGNSGAISWQTGRRVRALADAVARID